MKLNCYSVWMVASLQFEIEMLQSIQSPSRTWKSRKGSRQPWPVNRYMLGMKQCWDCKLMLTPCWIKSQQFNVIIWIRSCAKSTRMMPKRKCLEWLAVAGMSRHTYLHVYPGLSLSMNHLSDHIETSNTFLIISLQTVLVFRSRNDSEKDTFGGHRWFFRPQLAGVLRDHHLIPIHHRDLKTSQSRRPFFVGWKNVS